jgi:predicted nucleotidyltransferase
MNEINPYLSYWKTKQQKTQLYNQNLAQKAKENLVPIINYLIQTFKIKRIILFGSLVKGNFCETSDIDLAVEGIPSEAYFPTLAKINTMSDRWIDLKPIESLDPHFLKRVLETGECLYASDQPQ